MEGEGTVREWIKKYDVIYKALAFAVAIVLWLYVVNVVNQTEKTTFRNISPEYTGSEELMNSANLMVTNQEEISVAVEVSGKRTELLNLSEDEVHVVVDISKCREAGEYTLPYSVRLPSSNLQLTRKTPSQITVRLDKIVSANVPVRVLQEGSIAEGYMADEITVTPKVLSITGLQDEIAQVSYARVRLTKKNITSSILEQMNYEFCNEDGQVLDLPSLNAENNTVEVSLPILKLREINLSVEIVDGGGAYSKNVNYSIEPEKITIAGESATVDALETIVIGVADLSKIQDSTTLPMQISLPENIKNISGETSANVDLEFSGLAKKTTNTTSIEIINIPSGYIIEPITNSLNVQVRGNETNLQQVLPQNIRAVVDLTATALSPGRHTIAANVIIDGVKEVGAIGEYKVVIRVSKK